MSVDIMERLRAMAEDVPAPKSKPKAEPKSESNSEPTPEPEIKLAPQPKYAASTDAVPVVVLEDGTTFSNLNGCRICFVPDDAEDIDADDFAAGIPISDLYALYRSLKTLVG